MHVWTRGNGVFRDAANIQIVPAREKSLFFLRRRVRVLELKSKRTELGLLYTGLGCVVVRWFVARMPRRITHFLHLVPL